VDGAQGVAGGVLCALDWVMVAVGKWFDCVIELGGMGCRGRCVVGLCGKWWFVGSCLGVCNARAQIYFLIVS